MHLLLRETRSLDETEQAEDLGHAPADIVLLSFSDSDLGAAAMGWSLLPEPRPALRLANLARLRHPMSVDLYAEDTLARSRCVVIRLLGGLEYWRYGAEEVAALCRREGIPLALLPGDGRDDEKLAALSTVPPAAYARMDALLSAGGPNNLAAALRLAAHWAGLGPDDGAAPLPLPSCGEHALGAEEHDPQAVIVFYRSHLLSGDIAPMLALAAALRARGLRVRGLFVASLKEPASAALAREKLASWRPAVVLNATAFSARQDGASPLEAARAPILQLILSGAARALWEASPRGLSQGDLAMQVVLPELDGRLLTAAIGFKAEAEKLPGLEQSRTLLAPDEAGIALAAGRALGWARLAATPRAARRIAVLLSDYPAVGGQAGHAVGLDSFASLAALLEDLSAGGYTAGEARPGAAALAHALVRGEPSPFLPLAEYRAAFAALPAALADRITAAWGDPADDPACRDGAFQARHLRLGHLLLAVQPDRGGALDRSAAYHDPDTPPRHGYVAFYLALRRRADALVHLGTHGTLEWLPGKAVALSGACAPAALLGGLPVIYPFIANNPGEAAVARRRLGAVTLGHLTPPLKSAGHHGAAAELERLIDEYAAADGLDRRRTALLRRTILERAEEAGLLAEGHIPRDIPEEEALSRLDAWLCDVKELQIRDGLHVFGRAPAPERRALLLEALCRATPGFDAARLDASPPAERAALLDALDGRFIAPGPAGAPTRGRADVLPTGRNLYSIDPRGVPTRSALALAEKAAAELLRRHRQDQGDWPRHMVIDLWGSATMRTGGEDLALALLLLGARPVWDNTSARVTGVEIIPLALLDRPRVDVTLRISGLFRDAFPAQIALFDEAVRAVAARDEAAEWNPLAAAARGLEGAALRQATARVFGAAPGAYGTGVEEMLARGAWERREDLGRAWIANSAAAYGQGLDGTAAPEALQARLALADAFLHSQDHAETDLLESPDIAAHAGGFAAAASLLGAAPALYHADTARPGAPRLRALPEEVARVVRGRAANPAWIAGMMRHGHQGAAGIARAIEALHGFAATLPARFDRQFDLLHDATIGDEAVVRFMEEHNPEALEALRARFDEARSRGLWHARRNDV
ncbi:cobaltochelatase subunit CobN [Pseudoroseomonas rhizosphaerae]|uniref:Cobaltochelatase subunit CobN n=1 Tax=Teichococcus rhizosphaerae TaxID=1335062 RepID=A0A2C7AC97_9PROT|nr:cobaltochelatase subunit CobN [Pseudoroseomonas rhizosphaerae]PHK94277.1 cobaltochelatase subunit CobN [Pseudoroseomonas rhizosphaerae]